MISLFPEGQVSDYSGAVDNNYTHDGLPISSVRRFYTQCGKTYELTLENGGKRFVMPNYVLFYAD